MKQRIRAAHNHCRGTSDATGVTKNFMPVRPLAASRLCASQTAANRQVTYPDYHLILLRAVRYWEFTYRRNGV